MTYGKRRHRSREGDSNLNYEYGRWYVVGGRWGRAGSRCQGLNQDSGVRIQEPGVRSENEEHLLPAFSLLLSALRLLPSAYCLLRLTGVRVGGTLGPYRSLRQDVIADREIENL